MTDKHKALRISVAIGLPIYAPPAMLEALLSDLDAANSALDARDAEIADLRQAAGPTALAAIRGLRSRAEKAERERDAAIAERGAYCERVEALLADVKRLREMHSQMCNLSSNRGMYIDDLESEVKRLREMVQLGQESPRPPIDFDEPDDAARGGAK